MDTNGHTILSEDYCSYEVSKLLKDKGFNDPFTHMFINKDNVKFDCSSSGVVPKETIACPTHQMAMKWLREVYGLHISLEPCYDYDSMHVVFLAFVQNVADVHEFFDGRKNVASYPNAEKSYELAIKYCLENLI